MYTTEELFRAYSEAALDQDRLETIEEWRCTELEHWAEEYRYHK